MATENLSKINGQLKREITKKNKEILALKKNDKDRFLEWKTQKDKACKAEEKAMELEKEISKLKDKIDNQERAYRRLSNIVKSLTESLYYSSEALNNIAGGF
jgi:chromosome segregation ATPase